MDEHTFIDLTPENKGIIGENAKNARRSNGMIGKDIAKELPFSLSFLYALERGDVVHYPSDTTLARLAVTLRLPSLALFEGCLTTRSIEAVRYTVLSIKKYSECYELLTSTPPSEVKGEDSILGTEDSILGTMEDIKSSMKRLEASMTYILRVVHAYSARLHMPKNSCPDEDKF